MGPHKDAKRHSSHPRKLILTKKRSPASNVCAWIDQLNPNGWVACGVLQSVQYIYNSVIRLYLDAVGEAYPTPCRAVSETLHLDAVGEAYPTLCRTLSVTLWPSWDAAGATNGALHLSSPPIEPPSTKHRPLPSLRPALPLPAVFFMPNTFDERRKLIVFMLTIPSGVLADVAPKHIGDLMAENGVLGRGCGGDISSWDTANGRPAGTESFCRDSPPTGTEEGRSADDERTMKEGVVALGLVATATAAEVATTEASRALPVTSPSGTLQAMVPVTATAGDDATVLTAVGWETLSETSAVISAVGWCSSTISRTESNVDGISTLDTEAPGVAESTEELGARIGGAAGAGASEVMLARFPE